jgi:hypothetical protein
MTCQEIWTQWALFTNGHQKNFKVSRPGSLVIEYSNLKIYVYSNGTIVFADSKPFEILYETESLNPNDITFNGTNIYIDNKFITNYNTKKRHEFERLGISEKWISNND